MDMLTIIKFIMGLKFGWVMLLGLGLLMGGSLIRNIFSGSFSVGKFIGGFNIFAGGVQGKLLYYGLLAILAFGLYHQLTKATTEFNTDFRNNINGNRDVYLDQRVGDTCTEKCAVAIQPFGFTILKVGCVKSCEASITQQTKVDKTNPESKIVNTPTKKLNTLSAPLRWFGKLFKKKVTK